MLRVPITPKWWWGVPALPTLSIFFWAAFNVRWWSTEDGGQAVVLAMFHIIVIGVGVATAIWKNEKPKGLR